MSRAVQVEIDRDSGFCGGVIRAINGAEAQLAVCGGRLYSLGAVVHNEAELGRLEAKGLTAITLEDIRRIAPGSTVLIRAHGEPPSTYAALQKAGMKTADFTCPVVLRLQKRIRQAYDRSRGSGGQVLIYGKVGHAEVLGLLGQVDGDAVVIEDLPMYEESVRAGRIRLCAPVEVFSQTTKSPVAYAVLCTRIARDMAEATGETVEEIRRKGMLTVHDTICSQVSNRHEGLADFALRHSVVVFVAGRESSNGKVLCGHCRKVNGRTYRVGGPEEVDPVWFRDGDRVGVCGATSTPKWLLEAVAKKILVLTR